MVPRALAGKQMLFCVMDSIFLSLRLDSLKPTGGIKSSSDMSLTGSTGHQAAGLKGSQWIWHAHVRFLMGFIVDLLNTEAAFAHRCRLLRSGLIFNQIWGGKYATHSAQFFTRTVLFCDNAITKVRWSLKCSKTHNNYHQKYSP